MGILYSEVCKFSENKIPRVLKLAPAFQMELRIPVTMFPFLLSNFL